MSNKVQEINFFKGVVSHPNSISVGAGTFRDIKNGWHLRDGIIDKRPGFSIGAPQKAPGFLNQFTGFSAVPKSSSTANTFVRQDQTLGLWAPNAQFLPITGGDTTDAYKVTGVASSYNGQFVAISKFLDSDAIETQNFLSLYSLADGSLQNAIGDGASVTHPLVEGMCFNTAGTKLYFARTDTNKIYSWDLKTTVTTVAGNGSAGLGTGSTLTSLAIGPTRGMTYYKDGSNHEHLYVTASNGVLDLDLTANTSTLIAGSTSSGYTNASGASARFNTPFGIDYFTTTPGTLYVADSANNAIRAVVVSSGSVTTFAGSASGTPGHANGTGTAATFHTPNGLSCLTGASPINNQIFVSDSANFLIRQINIAAAVTTAAGTNGLSGYLDGDTLGLTLFDSTVGVSALANGPFPQGKIFVADQGISRLRCIDYDQYATVVSTWCGTGNGIVVSNGTVSGSNYFQLNNRLGYAGGIANCPKSNGEYGFSSFEFNGVTYLNTARGVLALDTSNPTISNVLLNAGAPTALDLQLSLVGSPGTLLTADHNAGYRMIWGRTTSSGAEIVGPPSSLAIITNPSGAPATKDVQIVSNIPPGIDATWTYQLYRTLTNNSSSGTIPPGDTEFLVFEASPTSTDLLNGFVTITDSTPDSLVGAALYTNATQETLSQQNTPPPVCMDMCLFQGMAIYANTIQAQQMAITLVGTSAFTNGDNINFVFSDTEFNFSLTANSGGETVSTGTFKLFTGGTAGANIENTAQSICRVINGYLSNRQIRAYYTSAWNGTPGQITLVGVSLGAPQWSVTCTSADSVEFSPPIPSSGTSYSSLAETRPNGIYVSKVNQPDAVPLVNDFLVGTSSESIRRVLPLRTSCLIIKERSVWRLTGTEPSSISITLLDNTVSLRSDHSVSLLNNEVYALTTQGVVAISDNGVRIVSRDIEFELTQVTGTLQAPLDLVNCCWGFGSDDWRMYFLSVFQTEGKAVTWCYSPFSNSWARWDLIVYSLAVSHGQIVAAVIADPNASATTKALKPFLIYQKTTPPIQLSSCYADDGGLDQISSINGNTVVLLGDYAVNPIQWYAGASSSADVGWVLLAHGTYYYVIANNAGTLTLNTTAGLSVNDVVTLYRPIDFILTGNPITSGATFNAKQWGDFFLSIESKNAYQFSTSFASPALDFFHPPNVIINQLSSDSLPDDANLFYEQVFRLTIPKQVAWGNIEEWTFEHSEAFAELVVKAIGFETRGLESTKVQQ